MAIYQVYDYDCDYEGHFGYFTKFSIARKVFDKFYSRHDSDGISLLKLDEKSGEFKEEDRWWKEDRYLREITKNELKRLPEEIFLYQGREWPSALVFIDEESMLRHLVELGKDENRLNHIKPTRENFAIHILSWYRNSCTFDHAITRAMASGTEIARAKINKVTREWKTFGEIYIALMNRDELRSEFEKIRESGHENCPTDNLPPFGHDFD
uniref:Uncharacterized protein n=1 Tax=Pithovirus LCPAC401 TaxID=2506595 RepID=A0A481Z9L0_9VIRU|nr:MAG: hypothetical protein LCPAC401_01350 [Pithovirus LCPAC401]